MSPSSTPTGAALALDGVSMHHEAEGRRIHVLRGVSLRVEAGTSLAVVGPSGSGKTSLLLLLAGLERPAAGRITLDGLDLGAQGADTLADLRRDRIGMVFQSFHLLPSLTALDNVALPLQMAGAHDALPRARAMLERVGLGERASHHPARLSGGEQQRVAIARAVVHRPRLLLADEPTGNLDDSTGERVRELLFGLQRDQGMTLVLVTHDPSFAARCDRVLRLQDGRLADAQARTVAPADAPLPA
jgi:putative ABC transport system ATP-binding protein